MAGSLHKPVHMRTPPSPQRLVRLAAVATVWLALVGVAPTAFAGGNLLVPDIEDVVPEAADVGAAVPATTIIPDSVTVAKTCVSCARGTAPERRNVYRDVVDKAPRASSAATNSFDEKLGLTAWREANAGRYTAWFRGHKWRSGNRSKSVCASVVKDILREMNVCTSRPDGHAYALYGKGTLVANCPRLDKLPSNRIADAKKASIIIYSGHVSKKPHKFGHIELKIPVTAALKKKMSRDHWVGHVPVGGYIYCSDFCRAAPSQRKTAPVAAIYEMT